jgi:hypothetical protein
MSESADLLPNKSDFLLFKRQFFPQHFMAASVSFYLEFTVVLLKFVEICVFEIFSILEKH